MQSDKDLLQAIENKDRTAFVTFYHRHASRIYKQVMSGFRDREAAEDFLQDFWAKVWHSPSFLLTNREGSTIPFLHCYTLRRIADFHRSRAVNREILLHDTTTAEALSPTYSHVIEDITAREIIEEISNIISGLSERDRAIYRMYHQENRSVKDIALHFSLSEGTVNNKLYAISKILRKNLRPAYNALLQY